MTTCQLVPYLFLIKLTPLVTILSFDKRGTGRFEKFSDFHIQKGRPMQRFRNFLLLMLMVSGVIGIPVAWPQSSDREVAFINVNVIPMDAERILQGHTVLVRGDRIIQVGRVA